MIVYNLEEKQRQLTCFRHFKTFNKVLFYFTQRVGSFVLIPYTRMPTSLAEAVYMMFNDLRNYTIKCTGFRKARHLNNVPCLKGLTLIS